MTTIPSQLRSLSELGVDITPFNSPRTFRRNGKRGHLHANTRCYALGYDTTSVTLAPLDLPEKRLCERCISDIFQGSLSAAWQRASFLVSASASLASAKDASASSAASHLSRLRHVAGELNRPQLEEDDALASIVLTLRSRVEARIKELELSAASPALRTSLIRTCAIDLTGTRHYSSFAGPTTTPALSTLLGESTHYSYSGPMYTAWNAWRSAVEAGSLAQARRAATTALKELSPHPLATSQLSFPATARPRPGETLQAFATRLWVEERDRLFRAEEASWRARFEENLALQDTTLVAIQSQYYQSDSRTSSLITAFMAASSSAGVLLALPEIGAKWVEVCVPSYSVKVHRLGLRKDTDSDAVLETACKLWDPSSFSISDALDAARRI